MDSPEPRKQHRPSGLRVRPVATSPRQPEGLNPTPEDSHVWTRPWSSWTRQPLWGAAGSSCKVRRRPPCPGRNEHEAEFPGAWFTVVADRTQPAGSCAGRLTRPTQSHAGTGLSTLERNA